MIDMSSMRNLLALGLLLIPSAAVGALDVDPRFPGSELGLAASLLRSLQY